MSPNADCGDNRINGVKAIKSRSFVRQRLEDDNYITIKVGKVYMRVLIDTGSAVSILSYRMAKFLNFVWQPLDKGRR